MKKYFLIPVAACVATISLVPVTIHAQDWTETFTAKKDLKLDYQFTVEFNDVPNEDLINKIVAVQGEEEFDTTIKYIENEKYVYVTVDGLQYDTAYELQVYLANGSKYKLDFTTAASSNITPSATIAELEKALEAYIGTTNYFDLQNNTLYQNALDLISQYEDALSLNEDTSSIERDLTNAVADVEDMTASIKLFNTKLAKAAAIVEKGPFQKEDMQAAFEEFLWQIESDVMNWTEPSQIVTDDIVTLIATLQQMAATDPVAAQALIDTLNTELENFVATTDYLYLSNSIIYQNAADAVMQYEDALFLKENIPAAEQAANAALTTVREATKKVQELNTKLVAAAKIVEDGPFQLDELQIAFDDFLVDLDFDASYWESAADISFTSTEELIKTLTEIANTNPQKYELLTLAEEIAILLEDYEALTDIPVQFRPTSTDYYVAGQKLIEKANELQASTDDIAIEEGLYALQEFIDSTEDYVAAFTELGELFTGATEANKNLAGWITLFKTPIESDTKLITNTLNQIAQDIRTKSYTELSTNLLDYNELLSVYAYDWETYIEELVTAEIDKYVGYQSTLFETKADEWFDTEKYIAFDDALQNAQSYDLSDAAYTTELIQALQKAYKAL